MRPGKQKCQRCHGKGGESIRRGRFLDVWLACPQCHGKGEWWPNKKPSIRKGEKRGA